MQFTIEAITERKEVLEKDRAPLVKKRDALWAELSDLKAGETKLSVKAAQAREAAVREDIKALQTKLAPIDKEYALCARALGSKVMHEPIS